MSRIAYVNHRYLPHSEAAVHVEDRGYQFSDGVYEVIVYYNRRLVDGDLHLLRLQRSLKELGIAEPVSMRALAVIMREVMERNSYRNGSLYIQVSRGVSRRDHVIRADAQSSLVVTASREKPVNIQEVTKGTEVMLHDDIRWQRRDIKSIGLLANVLLKSEASKRGKREAWLLDKDGFVTEGAVSNAYIVDRKGTLITRGEGECLLAGITRHRMLELAKEAGIKVEIRPFSVEDIRKAGEAMLTSSTSHIVPVVRVDDMRIGDGKPGAVFQTLFTRYMDYIEHTTGARIWSG